MIIHWIDSITGNYGWTAAILTAIAFCFLIPLRIFANRNARLKRKVAPIEAAIKQRYGINSLGASVTEDVPPGEKEILAMEPKEREQKAAEEIEAAHKAAGYHFFIGLLPAVVESFFIVILYFLISSGCPQGPFSTVAFKEFWTFSGSRTVMTIYGLFYGINLTLNAMNLLVSKLPKGKALVVTVAVRVLSFGLMVYISYQAIPALLIAIVTLQTLSSIFNSIQLGIDKRRSLGSEG